MQIWKPGLQPYQSSVYSVQLHSITVLYAKPSVVRASGASFGGHWYKKDGGCHRIEPCDTRKDSGHSTDMLQVKNRVFDCVGRVISIDTYNFWCLFVSVVALFLRPGGFNIRLMLHARDGHRSTVDDN